MPEQQTDTKQVVDTIAEFHGDVFFLLEQLGEGGMGEVFRARQKSLDRIVAIKRLHSHVDKMTPHALERLGAEAKTLASLDHPNIVKIFTVAISSDRKRPFLVLEFVEGETLAQRLHKNGCMSASECLRIMEQVLPALDYAHKNGVVHRDLKPSNLMLTKNGHVKIMDFGIAKALTDNSKTDQGLTTSGSLLGTPFYMSPEQCQVEELDGRSDIYAIGCLLYQMLTGEPLFDGLSALDIMYKHINTEPQFPSDMDKRVIDVLATALAKKPNERFRTSAEFLEAMKQTFNMAGTVQTSRSSTRVKLQPQRKKAKTKNRVALLTLAAVFAGMLAAAGTILHLRQTHDVSETTLPETPRSLASARKEAEQAYLTIDRTHFKSTKEKARALVRVSEILAHWIDVLSASNEEKAKCCQAIGFRLNEGDSPLAKKMQNEYHRYSELASGKQDDATKAIELMHKAQMERHKRDYRQCLTELAGAAALAKKADSQEVAGDIANEFAATYQVLNENEKALEYAIQARKLYQNTSASPLRLAAANQVAARVLMKLNQHARAKPYLEEAARCIEAEGISDPSCYQRVMDFNNNELKMTVAYAEKNADAEAQAFTKALRLCPTTVSPNAPRQLMLYVHYARDLFALHPESLKPAIDTATAGLRFAEKEDILSPTNLAGARAELAQLQHSLPRKQAQVHFARAMQLLDDCDQ